MKKSIYKTVNYRRAEKAYYKYHICISTDWETMLWSEEYLFKKYGHNARTRNIVSLMYKEFR